MPPKKTPTKKGSKSPPASAFKSGKFKGDTPLKGGRKDNRHILEHEGFQNGIVISFLKKFNADEEPYFLHDYQLLRDSPDVMEELGINAVLSRKGIDGETPKKQSVTSNYDWKCFVHIVGEDSNTPTKRKALIAKELAHFNSNANSANYTYPRKIKAGNDATNNRALRTIDCALLDCDVVGLMLAAYPDTPLEELAEFDEIMSTFWSDAEHGRAVLEAYNNGEENEEGILVDSSDDDSDGNVCN